MTASAFLEILVSLSVQFTLLILAVGWMTKSMPGPLADRIWRACLLGLIGLTFAALAFPHLRLFPAEPPHSRADAVASAQAATATAQIVFGCWLLGAVFFSLRWLGEIWGLRSLLQQTRPVAWHELPTDVATWELHGQTLSQQAKILASPLRVSPFCLQFHRATIVIPEECLTYSQLELLSVLRHEFAHLSLNHPLHLFLQRLLSTLFWFHPAAWWAERQMTLARELHCDSVAVNSKPEAIAYLTVLLRICQQQSTQTQQGVLAFLGRTSVIRRRMNQIVSGAEQTADQHEVPRPRRERTWLALTAALTLAASLAWWPPSSASTDRSIWSPWPAWSANVLHTVGLSVRDYEIDGQRLRPQEFD